MQRANDNSNQTTAQLRQTVQTLALRVNQLERMLDGKELREAKVENSKVYQRGTRLSLSNGMVAPGWNLTDVASGVTSLVAGTGIGVSAATGAVTVSNTGVTSIVAGTGISISSATGAVTITNTGVGIDYDHIYIGGIEYTPGANPNNYDFLQVGDDGSSSWIPAMISPMPTGYEIYNVKKNHIHITGATAGNI